MSQPQQPAPLSSSSPAKSKSSLRRSSGQSNPTPSTTVAARGLLHAASPQPQPHFEEEPIIASHQAPFPRQFDIESEHEHAVESEHYGVGTGRSTTDPVPSFQPFFTLIEDSVTNEHHHPTVHYVFADDDSDIIAEAACHSLEGLDPSQRVGSIPPTRAGARAAAGQECDNDTHEDDDNYNHNDEDDDDERHHPRLPPPVAGVREHYLILDVQPRAQTQAQSQFQSQSQAAQAQSQSHSHSHSRSHDSSIPIPQMGPAYEVVSAQSLSADWQVLRSTITAAPTIGDGGAGAADEGEDPLMLRIEGRGNMPDDATAAAAEKETMEEMIERFQRRLEDIRQVMEANSNTTGSATVTGGDAGGAAAAGGIGTDTGTGGVRFSGLAEEE
ncbi:hypothetical protein ABEF95_014579 [Exophiala dermatitidis]